MSAAPDLSHQAAGGENGRQNAEDVFCLLSDWSRWEQHISGRVLASAG